MAELYSSDQAFIKKLTDIVLNHLHNERFGVRELVLEAGLSRSVLHRRLHAINNQNISQLIRETRLKKALELLKEDQLSVSEIAYQVGFGSPAYFSKCFHEFFGCTPIEAKTRDFPGLWPPPGSAEELPAAPQGSEENIPRKRKNNFLITAITISLAAVLWLLFSYFKPDHRFSLLRGAADQASIVVLPFKNFSGDSDNQYFADGIMEDILNDLNRISNLRVISRTTAEYYRNANLSAGEIAREVKARNVLEGSVRRQGNLVRVSVQLIDARRDQHLWSEHYDRELRDVLGVQSEIALAVAHKLKAVISEEEKIQIEKVSTQNPLAYDSYLRGRFLLHKANSEQRYDINREGLMTSLQYFSKAIEADPGFSEAYAAMANAWFNLSAWGWYQPYFEGIQNARKYTEKALALDPDCSEAHTIKGVSLIWPERKFEAGRAELLKALSLNPRFPMALQGYTQLLMITGPMEQTREYMNRLLEAEPYFWVTQTLNAWVYYFEEKHDKALEACLMARDLKPDFNDNQWLFFLNYAKLGEGEKACRQLQEIILRFPEAAQYADEIEVAYQQAGIPGLFEWLIDVNQTRPLPGQGLSGHPYFIGWWYAFLGDADQTIFWFQKNMEQQNRVGHYFNLIATNPDFDFIRNDPRFLALIEENGLAPYHYRASR
ncbi:MAG: helix-turn-helix domain-containing protein [Bacteroidales bacterium]|nr:helix-turn-helix domain-containing protein [Bacteroidales bacterium]